MNFSVGSDDGSYVPDWAVRTLKNTILLGRKAEEALASLERDGFLLEEVNVISFTPFICWPTKDVKDNSVTVRELGENTGVVYRTSLPPILEPTRDFCPDLSALRVTLGDCVIDGNVSYRTTISGQRVVWTGLGPIQREDFVESFGCGVRMPKSGTSWEPERERVIRLHDRFNSEKTRIALGQFAGHMAEAIVVSKDAAGRELAFANTLRAHVAKWMIEDGVAERVMRSLLDQTKVASVIAA